LNAFLSFERFSFEPFKEKKNSKDLTEVRGFKEKKGFKKVKN
jgi:hypothetical protein